MHYYGSGGQQNLVGSISTEQALGDTDNRNSNIIIHTDTQSNDEASESYLADGDQHLPTQGSINMFDGYQQQQLQQRQYNGRVLTANSPPVIPEVSNETDYMGTQTEQSQASRQRRDMEREQQSQTQGWNSRASEKKTVKLISNLESRPSYSSQNQDLEVVEDFRQHNESMISQKSSETAGFKAQINIVCRIKPPKLGNLDEVRFQRPRCSRSSSRGCGKQAFSFGQQSSDTTFASFQVQDGRSGSRNRDSRGDGTRWSSRNNMSSYQNGSLGPSSPPRGAPAGKHKQRNSRQGSIGSSDSDGLQSSQKISWSIPTTQRCQNSLAAIAPGQPPKRCSSAQRIMSRHQPILFYNKMLKNEGNYCVFTTRTTSKYVFACDQPYSGKLLNESLSTVSDVQFLQNQPLQFKFDAVYDETSSGRQEKLYSANVRPLVHNFVEGQNACIALFGPTSCGKTFTLKGGQGSERGIVPRAIEDILNLIKDPAIEERRFGSTPNFKARNQKIFLKMSVFMIHKEQLVDLLGKEKGNSAYSRHDDQKQSQNPQIEHYLDQSLNQVVSRVVNLNERLILCQEDFYIAVSDAYKYRKELSVNKFQDRDLRKKSHFIISLTLIEQTSGSDSKYIQLSQINFAELSGSEQAVNTSRKGNIYQNMREAPTHEFVSKSFNSLSCHLMRLIQRKKKNSGQSSMISEDTETKLVGSLRSTMSPSSNILIINCVDPSVQMFEHSLPSLKFCASVRDQIQKKLQKYHSSKPKKHQLKENTNFQSMMSSHIKNSERRMESIKGQLIDFEYQLQQNPRDQKVLKACKQFIQQLDEFERDFETLIQYSQTMQQDVVSELVHESEKTQNKIEYLKDKIKSMVTPKVKSHHGRMNSMTGARPQGFDGQQLQIQLSAQQPLHTRQPTARSNGSLLQHQQSSQQSRHQQPGIQVFNNQTNEDIGSNPQMQYTLSSEVLASQAAPQIQQDSDNMSQNTFQRDHHGTLDQNLGRQTPQVEGGAHQWGQNHQMDFGGQQLGQQPQVFNSNNGGSLVSESKYQDQIRQQQQFLGRRPSAGGHFQQLGFQPSIDATTIHSQSAHENLNQAQNQRGNGSFDRAWTAASVSNIQQFNTVDNRQVGHIPQSQLAPQPQRASQNSHLTIDSRSRSRSRQRMMLQQEADGGANTQAYPGTSYRSVRNSIEEGSGQNFNQPINGLSVQGSQQNNMNHIDLAQSGIPTPNRQLHANQSQSPITQDNMTARADSIIEHRFPHQPRASNRLSKNPNLIKVAESKFAQLRKQIDPPKQIGVSDLPTVEHIQLSLPQSMPDKGTIFDDMIQKSLYKTEDELVNDVCRLMLLQDQEGLKLRVLQLYRDKEQTLLNAQAYVTQTRAAEKLRHAQATLLDEQAQAITANAEEVTRYTQELEEQYRKVETELVETLAEQKQQIDSQAATLLEQQESMELLKKERDIAQEDRKEDHRLRLDAEKTLKETVVENQKLKQNYEIIKEHEMSIIRDLENKKLLELKQQDSTIQRERENFLEMQHKGVLLNNEVASLKQTILTLENDVRIRQSEYQALQEKSEKQATELEAAKHDISVHKMKQAEDLELIQILRKQQEAIKRERDAKEAEISRLHEQVHSNGKSVDNQQQLYLKLQGELKLLEKDLEQLRADKLTLKDEIKKQKEQIAALMTEKDILIQTGEDEKAELGRQLNTLQQILGAKDKELMMVKAQEFDKVDIIKKLAETEGQCKMLEDEKARLEKRRDDTKIQYDDLKAENEQLVRSVKQMQSEMNQLKIGHDQNLDQFDQKFENLHVQLEQATSESLTLKDKVKTLKEQIHESDNEKNYWRDKCRNAERKGDEINQKIVELESELRAIIFDKHAETQRKQDAAINPASRAIEQRQVFGDIQSMIKKYRQGRSDSRAASGGRQRIIEDQQNSRGSSPRERNRHLQNSEPTVLSERRPRPADQRPPTTQLYVPQATGYTFAKHPSPLPRLPAKEEIEGGAESFRKPANSTFGQQTSLSLNQNLHLISDNPNMDLHLQSYQQSPRIAEASERFQEDGQRANAQLQMPSSKRRHATLDYGH